MRTIDYQEKDFRLLYSVQDRINQYFDIYLPKEEFAWIYLSIRKSHSVNVSTVGQGSNRSFQIICQTLFLINGILNYSDILLHRFLSRLVNNGLSPLLNKELKEVHDMVEKHHSQIHKVNTHFLVNHSQILPFFSRTFEDVALIFTLYMDMVFRYYQPVKQVLFILEGDYLVVQAIRIETLEQLGDHHHSVTGSDIRKFELHINRSDRDELPSLSFRLYLRDRLYVGQ